MSERETIHMFLGFLFNGLTPPPKTSPFIEASPVDAYFQEQANVVSPIYGRHKGRVQLHGVYWFAKLSDSSADVIEVGSSVAVVDRENNTLIVVLSD